MTEIRVQKETLRIFAVVLLLVAVCLPARAGIPDLPKRLRHLVERLPSYGQIVDIRDLGITIGFEERPPSLLVDGYNFLTPANIDRSPTTAPEYAGQYPGLYLNQPLNLRNADTHYLFISDQPEEIRENREREDGTRGAVGVYARAAFPKAASIRVLMDHVNGTERAVRLLLVWIPAGEGAFVVSQRGEASDRDSVAAGRSAFVQARQVIVEPRRALHIGDGIPVVNLLLKPGQTGVVHLTCVSSVPGQMAAVVLEPDSPFPMTLETLDALPTVHSIVWREEADRLKKYVDPTVQPRRYERILNSFQHARGAFPYPDRVASVEYDAASWRDASEPVRVYSLYESIPGIDPTPGTRDPRNPRSPVAWVDNRGKYGGVEELRIAIRKLPPHCHRAALLVLNPNNKFGGRHYVTDGHQREHDAWFLPIPNPPGKSEAQHPNQPGDESADEHFNLLVSGSDGARKVSSGAKIVSNDILPLLDHGRAALLWLGDVVPGDVLRMWTEPMANTSVYLWYLFVPLPDQDHAVSP